MKKKKNAKERRKQEAIKRQQKRNANKVSNDAMSSSVKTIIDPAASEAAERKGLNLIRAKSAGSKSVFYLGNNTIVMTSPGNGNDAVIEYIIKDETLDSADRDHAFDLDHSTLKKSSLQIEGRKFKRGEARIDDPRKSSAKAQPIRQDQIRAKEALEKYYYNQSCNDNIHIQIIYQIRDMEKNLALYISQIIFALNNLCPEVDPLKNDIIGNLVHTKSSFGSILEQANNGSAEEKIQQVYDTIEKLANEPRLGYFGNEIYCSLQGDSDEENRAEKAEYKQKIYSILWILSLCRQSLAHAKHAGQIFTLGEEYDHVDNRTPDEIRARQDARNLLNQLYKKRIDSLNNKFIEINGKDLTILFELLEKTTSRDKEALLKDYYEFVVLKQYKNLGFSIKRIREEYLSLVEKDAYLSDKYRSLLPEKQDGSANNERDKDSETVRQKFNKFFDLLVFLYYKDEKPEEREQIIQQLRSNSSNKKDGKENDGKNEIYRREAKRIFDTFEGIITRSLLPRITGKSIHDLQPDASLMELSLQDYQIGVDASYFSKTVYLLTRFLDGKEINILLTGLIHQFENIASFQKVIAKVKEMGFLKEAPVFTYPYQLFNDSKRIAEELRAINSFARMTGANGSPSVKKALFEDAIRVLGTDKEGDKLNAFLDGFLVPEERKLNEETTVFRNFLASNVVESNRFQYLIRYGDVKTLHSIATNEKVMRFVLEKEISDNQIKRYYGAISGDNGSTDSTYMRNKLIEKLLSFSTEELAGLRKSSPAINVEREKKKALVRLYLTVLYLLVKNLVNINSRYFIAFYMLDRDAAILDCDISKDRTKLTKQFTDKGFLDERACEYLEINRKNISNSEGKPEIKTLEFYRNRIMHLNVVRSIHLYAKDIQKIQSFYALYHFIMQKSLTEDRDYNKRKVQTLFEYKDKLSEYNTYVMDFVKALNYPFGYNLARYKNLSIEGLFDRNNPSDIGKKQEEI